MERFFKFYIFAFVLFSDFIMFAQPGDDDGGGGLEDDDPPAAPINSKIIWLAITGTLFVIYFFKQKRKAIEE